MMTTAPLAQFLGSAKSYVDAYQSAYGSSPGPYSSYEYDAVGVVAQAIRNAHSTTPGKITAALKSISYKGITGDFHFDSAGDRKPANYIVITVKGGSFAPYKEYDSTTKQWTNVS
jgi:ABC-type branched-subunit amino acid transport system substrate-binding protein